MTTEEIIRAARVFATCKAFGMKVSITDWNLTSVEQKKITDHLIKISPLVAVAEGINDKLIKIFTA